MEENRIGMLRNMAKLKHVDLASAMGVSQQTVVRWERGLTGIPDERKLALAEYFEVSVPFLMGWPEQPAGNGNGNDHARVA